MNYNIILFLAQSFLRAQGLGSAESGIVLLYSEHFGLSRIRRDREKESPKRKTKPFQTHSKPFFQRAIFVFSPKTPIFDKFRQTFLCKTKPIWKLTQMFVTNELTRYYNRKDTWCRGKNEPKTKPIQTQTNPIFSSGFSPTVSGNERRFILIIIGFCGILNSHIWSRRSKLTGSF